tara:strand:+ start:196 stop:600 length:405 start_codon:yes stop_codon:yes gene_type:complete
MWVGPFWFFMLVYPESERTELLMKGPWFFIGPIAIWFFTILMDPSALLDLFQEMSKPSSSFDALILLLSTPAGALAAWAHMVAGDIIVTRWIWKRSMKMNTNVWVRRSSIFFGVMLMPVGLMIHVFMGQIKEDN